MPITTLKKLGKNKSDLISTNMKMTNFTGEVINAVRVLVVDITMGPKTLGILCGGCKTYLFCFIKKRLDSS